MTAYGGKGAPNIVPTDSSDTETASGQFRGILQGYPSAARIRTVTIRDFDREVLRAPGPVAVEFMSYGCGDCRAIEPIVQKVAEAAKSRVKICRVNVPVDQELSGLYGISATPTFVMFLRGREVGRVEGPQPTVPAVLAAMTRPFGLRPDGGS